MLFYLLFIFSENKMYDGVDKIAEYTDINLLLAIQLLIPSSDSKDFVDRPSKRPLKDIVNDFKKIEGQLGIKSAVLEAFSKKKNLARANSARDALNPSMDVIDVLEPKYKIARIKDDEDSTTSKHKKNKYESLVNMFDFSKGNLFKSYFKSDDAWIENIDKATKLRVLTKFVEDNFHPVGYDLTTHEPEDFTSTPRFLETITDKDLLNMSKALQNTWRELSRISTKIPNGGSTTLLDLPKPFMVPGGRFREFYYWDTYWILTGLLVSDMHKSAENIVLNFIAIIEKYGYIPNGTRKYYFNRSEPPFFCMMLLKLLDIENGLYNDLVFNEGLNAALKEYEFWTKYKTIEIEKNGKKHELQLYRVHTDFPRPESFSEDVITFERQDSRSENEIYTNLKSGAESGWDFSSRWLENSSDVGTIRALQQVPVDLNAILYRNEVIISTLLSRIGKKNESKTFLERSIKRIEAINEVLWNPIENVWMDYLYNEDKFVDSRFYFSNITPMIYGIKLPEGKTIFDILKKYSLELFGYKGGVPVSGKSLPTTQQWDYPNAWAPHQHMIVEFLLFAREEDMAFHIAKSFFNSVYSGFRNSKAFFEKYDCRNVGNTGGGGEYLPQTGFGWTNGTILSFIDHFKDKLMEDYDFAANLSRIMKNLETKTRNPPVRNVPEHAVPMISQVVINIKN